MHTMFEERTKVAQGAVDLRALRTSAFAVNRANREHHGMSYLRRPRHSPKGLEPLDILGTQLGNLGQSIDSEVHYPK
jgi:hypothetical protein